MTNTGTPNGRGDNISCLWSRCSVKCTSWKLMYEHVVDLHLATIKRGGPFLCRWMGCNDAETTKAFNKREHLKSHLMSHVNYYPYSCEFCHQQFKRKPDMNKHMTKSTSCSERLQGLSLWNIDRVCKWLSDTGMHDLHELFKAHFIDGRVLMTIDESYLSEKLGIEDATTREKILALIRAKKRSYRGADVDDSELRSSARRDSGVLLMGDILSPSRQEIWEASNSVSPVPTKGSCASEASVSPTDGVFDGTQSNSALTNGQTHSSVSPNMLTSPTHYQQHQHLAPDAQQPPLTRLPKSGSNLGESVASDPYLHKEYSDIDNAPITGLLNHSSQSNSSLRHDSGYTLTYTPACRVPAYTRTHYEDLPSTKAYDHILGQTKLPLGNHFDVSMHMDMPMHCLDTNTQPVNNNMLYETWKGKNGTDVDVSVSEGERSWLDPSLIAALDRKYELNWANARVDLTSDDGYNHIWALPEVQSLLSEFAKNNNTTEHGTASEVNRKRDHDTVSCEVTNGLNTSKREKIELDDMLNGDFNQESIWNTLNACNSDDLDDISQSLNLKLADMGAEVIRMDRDVKSSQQPHVNVNASENIHTQTPMQGQSYSPSGNTDVIANNGVRYGTAMIHPQSVYTQNPYAQPHSNVQPPTQAQTMTPPSHVRMYPNTNTDTNMLTHVVPNNQGIYPHQQNGVRPGHSGQPSSEPGFMTNFSGERGHGHEVGICSNASVSGNANNALPPPPRPFPYNPYMYTANGNHTSTYATVPAQVPTPTVPLAHYPYYTETQVQSTPKTSNPKDTTKSRDFNSADPYGEADTTSDETESPPPSYETFAHTLKPLHASPPTVEELGPPPPGYPSADKCSAHIQLNTPTDILVRSVDNNVSIPPSHTSPAIAPAPTLTPSQISSPSCISTSLPSPTPMPTPTPNPMPLPLPKPMSTPAPQPMSTPAPQPMSTPTPKPIATPTPILPPAVPEATHTSTQRPTAPHLPAPEFSSTSMQSVPGTRMISTLPPVQHPSAVPYLQTGTCPVTPVSHPPSVHLMPSHPQPQTVPPQNTQPHLSTHGQRPLPPRKIAPMPIERQQELQRQTGEKTFGYSLDVSMPPASASGDSQLPMNIHERKQQTNVPPSEKSVVSSSTDLEVYTTHVDQQAQIDRLTAELKGLKAMVLSQNKKEGDKSESTRENGRTGVSGAVGSSNNSNSDTSMFVKVNDQIVLADRMQEELTDAADNILVPTSDDTHTYAQTLVITPRETSSQSQVPLEGTVEGQRQPENSTTSHVKVAMVRSPPVGPPASRSLEVRDGSQRTEKERICVTKEIVFESERGRKQSSTIESNPHEQKMQPSTCTQREKSKRSSAKNVASAASTTRGEKESTKHAGVLSLFGQLATFMSKPSGINDFDDLDKPTADKLSEDIIDSPLRPHQNAHTSELATMKEMTEKDSIHSTLPLDVDKDTQDHTDVGILSAESKFSDCIGEDERAKENVESRQASNVSDESDEDRPELHYTVKNKSEDASLGPGKNEENEEMDQIVCPAMAQASFSSDLNITKGEHTSTMSEYALKENSPPIHIHKARSSASVHGRTLEVKCKKISSGVYDEFTKNISENQSILRPNALDTSTTLCTTRNDETIESVTSALSNLMSEVTKSAPTSTVPANIYTQEQMTSELSDELVDKVCKKPERRANHKEGDEDEIDALASGLSRLTTSENMMNVGGGQKLTIEHDKEDEKTVHQVTKPSTVASKTRSVVSGIPETTRVRTMDEIQRQYVALRLLSIALARVRAMKSSQVLK
eukprot:CFRG2834T1